MREVYNSMLGTQNFKSAINMEDYQLQPPPASNDPKHRFSIKDNDMDNFLGKSKVSQEIKKNMDGMRQVMVTYAKNRVPLGEDKFNSSDMFKNIIEMLKASENMHMVAMQQESNAMQMQSTFMKMSDQLGKQVMVEGDTLTNEPGQPNRFMVHFPKDVENLRIVIVNKENQPVTAYDLKGSGVVEQQWDGHGVNGPLPAGVYQVMAAYEDANGQVKTAPMFVSKALDEVRYDGPLPVYYSQNQPIKRMVSMYQKPNNQVASMINNLTNVPPLVSPNLNPIFSGQANPGGVAGANAGGVAGATN